MGFKLLFSSSSERHCDLTTKLRKFGKHKEQAKCIQQKRKADLINGTDDTEKLEKMKNRIPAVRMELTAAVTAK